MKLWPTRTASVSPLFEEALSICTFLMKNWLPPVNFNTVLHRPVELTRQTGQVNPPFSFRR